MSGPRHLPYLVSSITDEVQLTRMSTNWSIGILPASLHPLKRLIHSVDMHSRVATDIAKSSYVVHRRSLHHIPGIKHVNPHLKHRSSTRKVSRNLANGELILFNICFSSWKACACSFFHSTLYGSHFWVNFVWATAAKLGDTFSVVPYY